MRKRLVHLFCTLFVVVLGQHALAVGDTIVVFNEVMYNPPGGTDASEEWLELVNRMSYAIDLSDWSIEGAIEYTFPDRTIIEADGFLVVAVNPGVLASRIPSAVPLHGPYEGKLSNGGELMRLWNNGGRVMDQLNYDDRDPWPVAPDGSGVTLARDPFGRSPVPVENWGWSAAIGGTPGKTNTLAARATLRFNEYPDPIMSPFWLELVNTADHALNLSAFRVVHEGQRDTSVRLGDHTLTPGDWHVLDASTLGFSPQPGDKVLLYDASQSQVLDALRVEGWARGRSPHHQDRWLTPQLATPGAANAFALQDEVVINEIMYHQRYVPIESEQEAAASQEAWIELYNPASYPVDLTGWRLSSAVEYVFPSGTVLQADQYLVIAADVNDMTKRYPDRAHAFLGPFTGRLSHRMDTIVLRDPLDNPVDEVRYFDGGRWPAWADGYGSSLEFRDPRADNANAAAWAPSREGDRSQWHTYTLEGVASPSAVGPDGQWMEFVLGLLEAGEVWLDDISVIEDPEGTPVELIQDGGFDTRQSPWRMLGNHGTAAIVPDPDDPTNRILRLLASGPGEHMHNHVETTLLGNRDIVNGRAYRISLRAKWIGGSGQLLARLYFNRLAQVIRLRHHRHSGTPGLPNSVRQDNIGPTFRNLRHHPAVPGPGQPVTISVDAQDPDGLAQVTLWWAEQGRRWQSAPMVQVADERHTVTLSTLPVPGAKIHYYIEAEDGQGATAMAPRDGPEGGAMLMSADGEASPHLHNLRIIMRPEDARALHDVTHVMSNHRRKATVIFNEEEIYYGVGVRLKGSQRGRAKAARHGYHLRFPADQPFLGVHRTVALDRSEQERLGQREMLFNIMMNRAGGVFSKYSDLVQCMAPLNQHNSTAELQLARFDEEFLASQFPQGDEGTVFEYELIYYPTTTDNGRPDGLKRPNPDRVSGTTLRGLGPHKENYRWNYLIKNNRQHDDYSRLMAVLQGFGQSSPAFSEGVDEWIDVDQWLRYLAMGMLDGCGDNFVSGAAHNALFYVRPSDRRVLFFPHDLDRGWNATRGLVTNDTVKRLIAESAYARLYYGHAWHVLNKAYNGRYLSQWTQRLGGLLPEQPFTSHQAFIETRSEHVMTLLLATLEEPMAFTAVARPVNRDRDRILIKGEAWIDVHHIVLAGQSDPLPLEWSDLYSWQVEIPRPGLRQTIILIAYDFDGRRVASLTVPVVAGVPLPR